MAAAVNLSLSSSQSKALSDPCVAATYAVASCNTSVTPSAAADLKNALPACLAANCLVAVAPASLIKSANSYLEAFANICSAASLPRPLSFIILLTAAAVTLLGATLPTIAPIPNLSRAPCTRPAVNATPAFFSPSISFHV